MAREYGRLRARLMSRNATSAGLPTGDGRQRKMFVSPPVAWHRLRDMQDVVEAQPDIARAVRCLSLYDQLDLTLELLQQDYWPEFHEPEDLPTNVIRFRRRDHR
jgi:hypothetical protein